MPFTALHAWTAVVLLQHVHAAAEDDICGEEYILTDMLCRVAQGFLLGHITNELLGLQQVQPVLK